MILNSKHVCKIRVATWRARPWPCMVRRCRGNYGNTCTHYTTISFNMAATTAVKNNYDSFDRYRGETKNQKRHGETTALL